MGQWKGKKIAVVGAGFSGAVIGYQLANAGYKVEVVDTRNHIGGNCHSERDPQTGVMVHQYGPHIYHANDDTGWHFVKRFGEFMPTVGVSPDKLPANIFKRLPLRFNYDDNYFNDKYQGIPQNGYSHIIAKLLDHPHISVYLNQTYKRKNNADYDHVFYSGPLDEYFSCKFGRLGTYRYLNMDVSIKEALAVADKFIQAEAVNSRIPPFIISPFGMEKDG